MKNTHIVFVYGTLQRGCSNHGLLAGAQLLGSAVTEEDFVMRTLVDEHGRRGIPFVGRDLPIGPVHGEAYAVDDRTLAELDRLEGCVPDNPDASWYRRDTVSVRLDGQVCDAFIYLHERPASTLVHTGRWSDAQRLENPCWYFAYGSNMNPQRMLERGVPFDQCVPAVLRDHTLTFNKRGLRGREAYAHATREKGVELPGLLYRVSGRGLRALDRYEGVAAGHYRRESMEMAVRADHALPTHRVTAWVYLAEDEHVQDGLPVSDGYMQHIRRGHAILGLAV